MRSTVTRPGRVAGAEQPFFTGATPPPTRPAFGWSLVIQPTAEPDGVVVLWDNGLGCSSANGTVADGRISVRISDIPVEIVATGSNASVHVSGEEGTYQLVRTNKKWDVACE